MRVSLRTSLIGVTIACIIFAYWRLAEVVLIFLLGALILESLLFVIFFPLSMIFRWVFRQRGECEN